MDNQTQQPETDNPTTHPDVVSAYKPTGQKSTKSIILLVVILIILGVADVGVFVWQKHKLSSVDTTQSQLNTEIVNTKQQIASITNQNNGVVSTTQPSSGSSVSLASNQVSFTLPLNWVEATASNYTTSCYNGYYASKVTCVDTTVVVPSSLNTNNSASSYGGINISVYKHTDNTSAQDWYWQDLLGGLTPDPADITSTTAINGYSTYYLNQGAESLVYGSQSNNEYFVLSNSSYVVVITSNVKNNNGPNGTTKTNDNSQYEPTVKSLAQSVKIQGS